MTSYSTVPPIKPCTISSAALLTPKEDLSRIKKVIHTHGLEENRKLAVSLAHQLKAIGEAFHTALDARFFFLIDHSRIGLSTLSETFLAGGGCFHAMQWTVMTNQHMLKTAIQSVSNSPPDHWARCFQECQPYIDKYRRDPSKEECILFVAMTMAETHIEYDLRASFREYRCCRDADSDAVDREFVRVGNVVLKTFYDTMAEFITLGTLAANTMHLFSAVIKTVSGTNPTDVVMVGRKKVAQEEGYLSTLPKEQT
jgi:hypothetical protein